MSCVCRLQRPVNMWRRSNGWIMLAHRVRHRPTIKQTFWVRRVYLKSDKETGWWRVTEQPRGSEMPDRKWRSRDGRKSRIPELSWIPGFPGISTASRPVNTFLSEPLILRPWHFAHLNINIINTNTGKYRTINTTVVFKTVWYMLPYSKKHSASHM